MSPTGKLIFLVTALTSLVLSKKKKLKKNSNLTRDWNLSHDSKLTRATSKLYYTNTMPCNAG